MKTILISLLSLAFVSYGDEHLSLKLEAKRAIKLGNAYLQKHQEEEGYWTDAEHPALTALPLTAILRDPALDLSEPLSENIEKGFAWLLSQQKENGGIYTEGLATYNTSTSIMALLAKGEKELESNILKARGFLVGQQTDWGESGNTDTRFDGGIGYGGTYKHSDMSNTYLALEALYHTKRLAHDSEHGKQPELDWESALTFISRCQNLKETNDQKWASDDKKNKGGFVYYPGDSKAGTEETEDGKTALRSYGSMSYTGLLSLIHADLDGSDPRVKAVTEWLGNNFSLEENPGLKQQGLYYYYQAMAKALAAAGIDTLKTNDGAEIDWRRELLTKLVSTQRPDGSWINETSRWWENDPVLVTSYTVMTLQQIYYSVQ